MKALENAHKQEIKELINKWNNVIMPNFENEASLFEIELKKRHQGELEEFKTQVEKDQAQSRVHYSSEVLNQLKKAEALGLQGYYKQAKIVKKKLKKLKIEENGKFEES